MSGVQSIGSLKLAIKEDKKNIRTGVWVTLGMVTLGAVILLVTQGVGGDQATTLVAGLTKSSIYIFWEQHLV